MSRPLRTGTPLAAPFDAKAVNRRDALYRGPACGRWREVCPGDVMKRWDRNWNACNRIKPDDPATG